MRYSLSQVRVHSPSGMYVLVLLLRAWFGTAEYGLKARASHTSKHL
jgi:hypothetical protein